MEPGAQDPVAAHWYGFTMGDTLCTELNGSVQDVKLGGIDVITHLCLWPCLTVPSAGPDQIVVEHAGAEEIWRSARRVSVSAHLEHAYVENGSIGTASGVQATEPANRPS